MKAFSSLLWILTLPLTAYARAKSICDDELTDKLADLFDSDDFTCVVMSYTETGKPKIKISSEDPIIMARYEEDRRRLMEKRLKEEVSVSVLSAAILPGIGLIISAIFVPLAMATFGVVVPGVGTFHAAGGVAAVLQKVAYHLISWIGAGISWFFGLFFGRRRSSYRRDYDYDYYD